jgi:signal transduction histidine kinase
MLLAGDLGRLESGQKEYLEHILQLNEHLIGLVSGWEDVERLSSGQITLQAEACNIGLIIRQVASKKMAISRSGQWPMVLGDPHRLQQLLHDIFEVVGEGSVRARIAGETCVVTVESLEHVDHQTRLMWVKALKGEATTQYLGLRIARLLAEVHGGGLRLDPHATGSAKFHIQLPLAQQMSLLGDPAE